MQLDEFLHNLHFDIDNVRPVDVDVDWEDAPLPFKLYQNLPATPLSFDACTELSASRRTARRAVRLQEIGNFFWYSYGLTQLCHVMLPADDGEARSNVMQMLRRYVPSGGALYPSELYAYLKVDDVSPGIYHYDVAHHRFVLLREGNFDLYLERALGHRCQLESCFGALFVSTMFWKNFYKYHNFSYRLQALDAGALIGQLLEVAKRFGYASAVYFQFLDRAIQHLLGLRDEEESVYAVIPLACAEGSIARCDGNTNAVDTVESAQELCQELVGLEHRHYSKSVRKGKYPLLLQMNEAAMLHTTERFTQMPTSGTESNPAGEGAIDLPAAQRSQGDFATACRRRFSPALDFVQGHIDVRELSAIMSETMLSFAYDNDIDPNGQEFDPRVSLASCVHGVEGLNDGAYLYDFKRHGLQLLQSGDHRLRLQEGLSMPTVNFFQVPLCFHLVGSRDRYQVFGYRGYRMQQMEVGMCLQRLLLSASARGLGGHPLLGYDEGACDDIYNFEAQGKTCLIEVPVGHYRKTARFEGALYW
ncbi:SagB family peptide dehydrogenase [Alicyclobacillus fastidiosus]|uniref:SagB family peptide dehydrogenase n=1 Tax=Alicyclobacillus fastidiosus TaxID=392011 RepID=A0ABV5AER2_9BACL|nr:SagB family peptide dehydrogenase [Alicyclobacillus fastidiosus]WEH09777.1 SagB family peptide dehydrogenase [Alicyclobacillus fastidiosus]